MYYKVKGQTEEDIKKLNYDNYGIFRPGGITDREGARTAEKIAKYIPFFPKIESKILGRAMLEHAI